MQLCNGATLPTPRSPGFCKTLVSNFLRMICMVPKDQKMYNMLYDAERGDVLRPPHAITSAAVKIK